MTTWGAENYWGVKWSQKKRWGAKNKWGRKKAMGSETNKEKITTMLVFEMVAKKEKNKQKKQTNKKKNGEEPKYKFWQKKPWGSENYWGVK